MSSSRFIPETVIYLVPYVLISTFQYSVAQDGLKYSSPFVLMGLRYLIASLILFGVVRSFRPIVNKDTVLLSILTFASSGFWILGLEYVSTSESAVLSYTMPLIAIPMSYLILSEKASHRGMGGSRGGVRRRPGLLVCSVREPGAVSAWGCSDVAERFLLGDVHDLLPETKGSGTDEDSGNTTLVRSPVILSHHPPRFQS